MSFFSKLNDTARTAVMGNWEGMKAVVAYLKALLAWVNHGTL